MQKARSHPVNSPKTPTRLLPLVCTRVQVLFHSPSGVLFTFPSRYSPLSVTDSYLALEDGPPRFNRDFSCPGLLGYQSHPTAARFAYGTLTLYGRPFQAPSATRCTWSGLRPAPAPQPRQGLTPTGLGSSPFARRYSGNLVFDFSSSGYLDVSVPRVGSRPKAGDGNRFPPGCPIRISPDQCSLAAPRSFSQLATSFFADLCLGIHRVHLFA
jgi:hypothetical protein